MYVYIYVRMYVCRPMYICVRACVCAVYTSNGYSLLFNCDVSLAAM